jgi:hypothetical protein
LGACACSLSSRHRLHEEFHLDCHARSTLQKRSRVAERWYVSHHCVDLTRFGYTAGVARKNHTYTAGVATKLIKIQACESHWECRDQARCPVGGTATLEPSCSPSAPTNVPAYTHDQEGDGQKGPRNSERTRTGSLASTREHFVGELHDVQAHRRAPAFSGAQHSLDSCCSSAPICTHGVVESRHGSPQISPIKGPTRGRRKICIRECR